jgi:hypothetical protein
VRDRDAGQGAGLPGRDPRVGCIGLGQGLLGRDPDEGVQRRVEGGDPVELRLRQ